MKGNSKIQDKFFKKILTQKSEKLIFWLQNGGVDLYTGSTCTRVNTVPRQTRSFAKVHKSYNNTNDFKLIEEFTTEIKVSLKYC